jgi:hypothetical protein
MWIRIQHLCSMRIRIQLFVSLINNFNVAGFESAFSMWIHALDSVLDTDVHGFTLTLILRIRIHIICEFGSRSRQHQLIWQIIWRQIFLEKQIYRSWISQSHYWTTKIKFTWLQRNVCCAYIHSQHLGQRWNQDTPEGAVSCRGPWGCCMSLSTWSPCCNSWPGT